MNDERSAKAIDRKIGQRIRARRLEIGMSQERLAELLGVTFQQVQKYEKGVNRTAASRLWDISHALDLPVARFFEGLGPKMSPAVESVLETQEGAKLLSLFASVKSVKVRRRILDLVAAMVEEESPKR